MAPARRPPALPDLCGLPACLPWPPVQSAAVDKKGNCFFAGNFASDVIKIRGTTLSGINTSRRRLKEAEE